MKTLVNELGLFKVFLNQKRLFRCNGHTLQEKYSLLTSPEIILKWLFIRILLKFSQNFVSKGQLKFSKYTIKLFTDPFSHTKYIKFETESTFSF